ncbi:MAG: P-type conjugative transfer protein TrbJ, partial [Bradyrhizobium sp.]|nr:P-type conjugative transfer protein TrbJ [Bradyrhizobium sp.]
MNRLHRIATASIIAIAVAVSLKPVSAQLVVFDPNNYAQNVLTAARSLQQINNQVVSLQNQAQMLI